MGLFDNLVFDSPLFDVPFFGDLLEANVAMSMLDNKDTSNFNKNNKDKLESSEIDD